MTTWKLWVNVVLGLWIALSAYLDFSGQGLATNLTVIGIVIAVLSVWEIFRPSQDATWHRHHGHV